MPPDIILNEGMLAAMIEPMGKDAIGTVKGDLHDIGKNLAAIHAIETAT